MSKAFISYSAKDEKLALQLHRATSMAGIETFMAGISVEPGEKWTEEIFSNLKEAKWVFFLATKTSCASQAVQQELGASLAQEKTIIPVLIDIEPEELPGWVDRHQAIDINESPELLHSAIENIAEKIKIDKFWAGVMIGALVVFLVVASRK